MTLDFEAVAGPFDGEAGGVVWDGDTVLFTLVDEGRLMSFDPETGLVGVQRKYLNRVKGLTISPHGELWGCQAGSRRIVRLEADGSMVYPQDRIDGEFHNHPYDLVFDSTGRLWFTDYHDSVPASGPQFFAPLLAEQSVLRMERDYRKYWTIRRTSSSTRHPTALCLSRDESTLYVADNPSEPDYSRELQAYPVLPSGELGPHVVLCSFGADHRGPHPGLTGIAVDTDGNLFACGGSTTSGAGPIVYVISAGGRILETHPLPEEPAGLAFGDPDLHSLYVTTTRGRLLRAVTVHQGHDPNRVAIAQA